MAMSDVEICITTYSKEFGKQEFTYGEYSKRSKFTLHREDGPAVISLNLKHRQHREWWIEGLLHRTDGPAIEYDNGDYAWYIEGVYLSRKSHHELVQEVRDMPEVLRLVDPRKWVREFE